MVQFLLCRLSFHRCSLSISQQGLLQWAHLMPQYQGTRSHPTLNSRREHCSWVIVNADCLL
jgi:hypothetical protein